MLCFALFSGCGLFDSEDGDDLCKGNFELNYSSTVNGAVGGDYRECFDRIEASQHPAPQSKNWIDILYVRDGNPGGYFLMRLDSRTGDFFDAPLNQIDFYFQRLDANKLPLTGDRYHKGFEITKIDKATRQISFKVDEMEHRGEYARIFKYKPVAVTNLTIQ